MKLLLEDKDGLFFYINGKGGARYSITVTPTGIVGTRKFRRNVDNRWVDAVEDLSFTFDGVAPMEKGQAYNPPKDPQSSVLTRPIEPPAKKTVYFPQSYNTQTGKWQNYSKSSPGESLESARGTIGVYASPTSDLKWRIVDNQGKVIE